MSYSVRDTEGNISIFNKDGEDITNINNEPISLTTIDPYWILYSKEQHKRHKKLMNQMMETWFNVYETIKFCRTYSEYLSTSNNMMKNIYNLFITTHKFKVEYYNEERIRIRRKKDYVNKKLNKLRKLIQKI